MLALLLSLSLPLDLSAGTAFRCQAHPHFYSTRSPQLPGWGTGRTEAAASERALRSCRLANAFAFSRTCRVESCSRE